MVDKAVISKSAFLLGENPYQTRKDTWLAARIGKPAITYLMMIRSYLEGTKGAEADYVIAHGSPVPREIVDRYISRFR